jgi:signal peptidase II
VTVLATVAGSYAAKTAALRWLSGRPPIELLGGVVRFTLTENPGAFLGLGRSLSETARRAIFVGAMGVVLIGLLVWLLTAGTLRAPRAVAAGLMIGGGIANLLDRLPDGVVTDYVVLSAGAIRTGVFNLPDAAILAGAALWGIAGALRRKAAPDAPSSGA